MLACRLYAVVGGNRLLGSILKIPFSLKWRSIDAAPGREEAGQRKPRERSRFVGRSADDVFRDHIHAVNSGDIQTILGDYAEHAQMLTAQGALNGREGVEAFYTQAFSLLPGAQIAVNQIVAGQNSLLVWWSAESSAGRIDDGIDTFVIEDGLIVLQTPTFTVQHSVPG